MFTSAKTFLDTRHLPYQEPRRATRDDYAIGAIILVLVIVGYVADKLVGIVF